MQVTETAAAGLKREFRVVVPATDLEAKVNARLDDLKGKVQLRGFRPGKVPVAHLKRLYGKSAMAEVIEDAVREANSKIVTDNGYKLATEPKVVPDEGTTPTGRSSPRPKRPKRAIGSRCRSRAPRMASRSRAVPPKACRSCSARRSSFLASKTS
jgi:hypothetical protein